ncbi:trypsin domain-containing protein [Phthorimaea operculella]|nr:trypsin domain-containing protein [Phthorimaea operculella]
MLIRHIVLMIITHLTHIMKVFGTKMQGNIVGGDDATIKDFPHSAFIGISCVASTTDDYICGGSIINQNFILSAAHCFNSCDADRSTYVVVVGTTDYSKAKSHSVEKVFMHKYYSPKFVKNDIALIKLKNDLMFNRNVQRITIVKRPPAYAFAEIAGWGLLDEEEGTEGKILKRARQKVLSAMECVDELEYLPPKAFCAYSLKGYPAGGDSGSALVVHKYMQIGIVSYKDLRVSVELVVYTNVSAYISWIKTTMYAMSCKKIYREEEEIKNQNYDYEY